MLKWSQYSLIASLVLVVLAMACYILVLMLGRSVRQAPVMAHAGRRAAGGGTLTDVAPGPPTPSAQPHALALYGTHFSRLALVFVTACLVLRTIAVGHGPFSNQYEFSVAFGWGMIAAYIYFEYRYHVRTLALVILPLTAGLLLYALNIDAAANQLVPALQDGFLLTIHVAVAIVAYGALAVSFAAGLLYLIQPEKGRAGLPKPALLDLIGYRAVIFSFPLLTLTSVLGAIWAQKAWGSYWTWDPKETAALFTWLVYGAYLHARVARGWVGRRSAWLLMFGFAAVLLTFFGNLFFGGLHSYA